MTRTSERGFLKPVPRREQADARKTVLWQGFCFNHRGSTQVGSILELIGKYLFRTCQLLLYCAYEME